MIYFKQLKVSHKRTSLKTAFFKHVKVIFLFIDGVGLARPSSDNPLNAEVCPTLWRLIERHSKPIEIGRAHV